MTHPSSNPPPPSLARLGGLSAFGAACLVLGGLLVGHLAGSMEGHPEASLAREIGGVIVTASVVGLTGAILARWLLPGRADGDLGVWLLGTRWFAFTALFALVAQFTFIDPRLPAASAAPLGVITASLLVFNGYLVHRGPAWATTPRAVIAQTATDTVALAIALQVTGGITNPFGVLFVLHAVIAALFLPLREARLAVLGVAFGPVALTLLTATGAAPPLCIDFAVASCLAPDTLETTATGLATAFVTAGAGLVVAALTWRYRSERIALERSMAARAEEAAHLAATTETLREERGRLDAILDCIADAVVVADPDGRVVLHNRASAALWPGRAEGYAEDLRVCHDPSTWQELFRRLANPRPVEHHPVLRVGDRFFEATWGRVTRPGDATLLGAVMVARDVTERMREQSHREQRERLATVGRLAASLAHEINNPLSSIQLYTQHAVKALAGQQPLTDHLETVQRNADACKRIVRDLLTYARQRAPEKKPLPAAGLLELAARTVAPLAARHEVLVRQEDLSLAALVEADRDQIVQVLVNLALNAIEAMRHNPAGARRLLTLTCLRASPSEVDLLVADTGPGIPSTDHELVFNPFYTTREDGTGLGLAVSTDIARAHGGHLELQSEMGQGAVFKLRLPMLPARAKATAVRS